MKLTNPNVCFMINGELIWAWENKFISDVWHQKSDIGFLHYCRKYGRYEYKNINEYLKNELNALDGEFPRLIELLSEKNGLSKEKFMLKYGG